MKTSHLKSALITNLLILLLTAGLVSSCGSDDPEVVAAAPNTTTTPSPTVTNPTGDPRSIFIDRVNNNQFRAVTGWNFVSFVYCPIKINRVNDWGDFFDNFFSISFTWSTSWDPNYCNGETEEYIDYNIATDSISGHGLGANAAAVLDGLKNIVNNANFMRMYSFNGSIWEVFHGGRVYLIDLNQPMVANPVVDFPVNQWGNINGDGKQYVGVNSLN